MKTRPLWQPVVTERFLWQLVVKASGEASSGKTPLVAGCESEDRTPVKADGKDEGRILLEAGRWRQ